MKRERVYVLLGLTMGFTACATAATEPSASRADPEPAASVSRAPDGGTPLCQHSCDGVADASASVPASSHALLFGGSTQTGLAGDTWEWNGTSWKSWNVSGPPARTAHAMASVDGKPVVFGGYDATDDPLDETWEWQSGSWAQLIAPAPSARYYHGFATASGAPLVFGGVTDPGRAADGTWAWKAGKWSVRPVSSMPSPRFVAGLAARGSSVVLFGGRKNAAVEGHPPLDDTWEWDGSQWKMLEVSGPSARGDHGMASLGNKVYVFGGIDASGAFLSDTWEWDGATWTLRATTGPSARAAHGMTSCGRTILLFGGANEKGYLGDTWEWDGTAWAERKVAGPSARSRPALARL